MPCLFAVFGACHRSHRLCDLLKFQNQQNTGQNGSAYTSTITKMDSVGNFRTSAKTNADVIFLGQIMPKSKTCLYLCLAFES